MELLKALSYKTRFTRMVERVLFLIGFGCQKVCLRNFIDNLHKKYVAGRNIVYKVLICIPSAKVVLYIQI